MTDDIHLELTEQDTLLPCPFCGWPFQELQNTWTASYWITCLDCSATVHGLASDDPFSFYAHLEAKASAIARWNRRSKVD